MDDLYINSEPRAENIAKNNALLEYLRERHSMIGGKIALDGFNIGDTVEFKSDNCTFVGKIIAVRLPRVGKIIIENSNGILHIDDLMKLRKISDEGHSDDDLRSLADSGD